MTGETGASAPARKPLFDSAAGACRLRLHPVSFATGTAAAALCASGEALPLAGGAIAFTHARVTGRDAPAETSHGVPLAVPELTRWADDASARGDDGPGTLLAQAAAPRSALGGLALQGPGGRPRIMGIVNVTPDSFSDGGVHPEPGPAIDHARRLLAEGADILDIGGESTRPGAAPVGEAEELRRILPVIETLAGAGAVVSVDTRHAGVMAAAVAAGARIVNDVTALTGDPDSLATAAAIPADIILMHMQGTPETMQADPRYADVTGEVHDYLAARIAACRDAGIAPERLCVDPGFGFGKTLVHNFTLHGETAAFHGLGAALCIGVSRKSFIGRVSGASVPAERVPGSLAMMMGALDRGAQVVRVHDVAASRQALDVWLAGQAAAAGDDPVAVI